MRFDLSDEEWALLEPLLPKSRKSARVDDRKIVNAIFYVLRTGMPWRDLPARYGPYTTLVCRHDISTPNARTTESRHHADRHQSPAPRLPRNSQRAAPTDKKQQKPGDRYL
jgi:transposase